MGCVTFKPGRSSPPRLACTGVRARSTSRFVGLRCVRPNGQFDPLLVLCPRAVPGGRRQHDAHAARRATAADRRVQPRTPARPPHPCTRLPCAPSLGRHVYRLVIDGRARLLARHGRHQCTLACTRGADESACRLLSRHARLLREPWQYACPALPQPVLAE
eukprot:3024303-Prymnesium_polylepis.1